MNLCRILLLLLVTSLASGSHAQSKEVPYFQQEVNYSIDVELQDAKFTLHANMEVQYINHSPDTLSYLVFHCWPNAYKSETTPLAEQLELHDDASFYWSNDKERGYIDSLNFKQDGTNLKWSFEDENEEICYLVLEKPLLPGDSTIISTPFRVKLPSAKYSRLGYTTKGKNNHSFMISQWYPKPAVYKADGWHKMPYLNLGEFYSEFGSFEVSILTPKYLKVAGAGNMVFRESEELNFDDTEGIKGFKHHYKLEKAHDFAWFASNEFEHKKKTITLNSGKEVLIQAYFPYDDIDVWRNALNYMEEGLRFYSTRVGEYPYDVCTAVDASLSAGGGMEYPTITVISAGDNIHTLEMTLVHEIGHNWFYGILGFNERDYPWMDEGLNTYYQSRYEDIHMRNLNLFEYMLDWENEKWDKYNLSIKDSYYYSWLFAKRRNQYQPLYFKSDDYSSLNYGISPYYSAAIYFRYLEDYLGTAAMDSLMQGFFQSWQFKHPQPRDFIHYFKENSPKNVDWFFDDFFFENKNIDYAITRLKKGKDSLYVTVKNKGEVSTPFSISSLDKRDDIREELQSEGVEGKQVFSFALDQVSHVSIDARQEMPDINRNNNQAKLKRLFPTLTPKRLRFLYGVPFKGKDYLYFSPVVGINKSAGIMPGIALYNDPIFERKWEYQFVPIYSIRSNTVFGEAGLFRNVYTHGIFRKIRIGISGRMHSYNYLDGAPLDNPERPYLGYKRIAPEIDIFFRTPTYTAQKTKRLTLRGVIINRDELDFQNMVVGAPPSTRVLAYHMLEATYNYFDNRAVNPWGYQAKVQANNEIIKAQVEIKHRFQYNEKQWLDLRLFAGNFFRNSGSYVDYSFKMSSWRANDDYLFEHVFMDRENSIGNSLFANQMMLADGGFNIYTPLGRSWDWMVGLNLSSHVFILQKLLKVYGNMGLYPDPINENKATTLYEGGFKFILFDQHLEISFPIIMSENIRNVADLNNMNEGRYRIRFTFNINQLNPFKRIREWQI
jgi:hypothetical protein